MAEVERKSLSYINAHFDKMEMQSGTTPLAKGEFAAPRGNTAVKNKASLRNVMKNRMG